MNRFSDTLIILLGVIGGILLLGGVGYSAYSRVKKYSRSGTRLSDLLSNLEETLEVEEGLYAKRRHKTKPEAQKGSAAQAGEEKPPDSEKSGEKQTTQEK